MFPPVKGRGRFGDRGRASKSLRRAESAVSYSRQEIGIDVGYMRSVSHAPNCFVIESFMDELAAAAGKDPLRFSAAASAQEAAPARVLQIGAERAGWGKPAGRTLQGMALMEGYTTHLAQVAEISIVARRTQGAQDRLRRRLRPDGQSDASSNRKSKAASSSDCPPRCGARSRSWAAKCSRPTSTITGCCATTNCRELDVHLVDSDETPGRHRRSRAWPGGARAVQRDIRRHRQAAAGTADRLAEAEKGLAQECAVNPQTCRRDPDPVSRLNRGNHRGNRARR